MPATIPYDPSLTLASVVNKDRLTIVEAIAEAQAPVTSAQDALNSLIASKRSLDMTRTELKNLNADATPLEDELKKLGKAIGDAAAAYATAKMEAEPKIQDLRKQIRQVHSDVESPVDYLRTDIKYMPLAADTMNMDVQYFTFDSNSQNASTFGAQVASYVSTSASIFGDSASTKLGTAASTQVTRQISKHRIEGTLVFSVTCTHKKAAVLAPFVLHIDKAIKVWNKLYPDNKLDPTNRSNMMKIAMNDGNAKEGEKFSIISGTTFGSSFVGMVHILNSTDTSASESLTAAATSSITSAMVRYSWFSKLQGKVGLDAKFAADVKNLLSSQNVTSHVTLISMGVIPSIVANEVSKTVQNFKMFDPESNMAQVAKIQTATTSDRASIESMAEASRTGEQSADLQGRAVESSLSALAAIDESKNKVLDVNSMMTALEDYLQKAAEGESGVPINYYLKDIDQKMLAEMWTAKYFPGEYLSIKYDDSGDAGPEKAKL